MPPKMSLLPDGRLGRVATASRSGTMNEGWAFAKRVTSRVLGPAERHAASGAYGGDGQPVRGLASRPPLLLRKIRPAAWMDKSCDLMSPGL